MANMYHTQDPVDGGWIYKTPDQEAPIEYKGFQIGRVKPHWLYRIVSREGFDLWRGLDGSYTSAEMCKKSIDAWYQEHEGWSADDAYIPIAPLPRRGRPTKQEQAAKELKRAKAVEASAE